MLYLSQILNGKVTDSSDKTVGRLKDILIGHADGSYSPLKYILIRDKKKQEIFVPYEAVENLSPQDISLRQLWDKVPKKDSDGDGIYLVRDCLDQQIVDTEGARVVRVNDLKIGLFKDKMCVLGLDISFKGLLRRLGLAWLDFVDAFKVNLIDWRKAYPVKGILKLDTISKDLTRLHPADLANIIEDLNIREGSQLVKHLGTDAAAQVLEEVEPELQKNLVKHLGATDAADIIERMSVDEITDLVKMLPKTQVKEFLSLLENKDIKKVEKLISYEDDTAGGLMTTDFVAAGPEWTVAQTVEEIRRLSPELRSIIYVYVSDEAGDFKGTVSVRHLLITPSETKLSEIMKQPSGGGILRPEHDVDEIISIMTKYNLYTAAVVEENNKLLGIVTIDDVMRCLAPNA